MGGGSRESLLMDTPHSHHTSAPLPQSPPPPGSSEVTERAPWYRTSQRAVGPPVSQSSDRLPERAVCISGLYYYGIELLLITGMDCV